MGTVASTREGRLATLEEEGKRDLRLARVT